MARTEYTITYPLNVEALPVPVKDNEVNSYAGALTDFSMLPHRGNSEECLPPRLTPNVSEDLVSKPFESTSDPLKSGIHLHWALPRCLRTASIKEPEKGLPAGEKPEMNFRIVPNRWLVQRTVTDELGNSIIAEKDLFGKKLTTSSIRGTKTFYIESDLLSVGNPGSSRAFPHRSHDFRNGDMLYRYTGKLWHYEKYLEPQPSPSADADSSEAEGEYLESLTAFGYGEPLYGAYYPECRNVFGFHDDLTGEDTLSADDDRLPEFDLTKMAGNYNVNYHVVGWYSEIKNDPCFLAELFLDDEISLPTSRQGFALKWDVRTDITDWGLDESAEEQSKRLNARTIFRKHLKNISWSSQVYENDLYSKLLKRNKLIYSSKFESGSSNLTAGGKSALKSLVRLMKAKPLLHIDIECHTDSDGPEDANLDLSQRRAESVRDWFIGQDIDTTRMTPIGLGEEFPIEENNSQKGKAANRRIEIKRSIVDSDDNNAASEYAHDSDLSRVKVAIGNTPGQALSALLANLSGEEDEKIQQSELMLDAMQLGLLGETDDPDLLSKIDTGMHKAAFQPTEGGHSWKIILSDKEKDFEPGSELKTTHPSSSIIAQWNGILTTLNEHQWNADQLRFTIQDEQKQLYSDWYKFMVAEYNLRLGEITSKTQVNQIREFILAQMNGLSEHLAELKSTHQQIDQSLSTIDQLLADWNQQVDIIPTRYEIQKVAADRFWSPSEPAILLYGDGIDHSKRYHQKNAEEVIINEMDLGSYDINPHYEIHHKFFDANLNSDVLLDERLTQHFRDVWSPLYLDWQVKLYPVAKPHSIDNEEMDWRIDSILGEYNLGPGEIELLPFDDNVEGGDDIDYIERFLKSDNTKILQFISGRSILTPNAHESLVQGMRDSLGKYLEEDGTDPLSGLINQLQSLKILSQNISGFNDALLMQKQVLQLSVFDPLADNHVLDRFTNELLRKFIGKANTTAPLPLNLFLPIREGYLKIDKLRVVDTFGRVKEWEDDFESLGTFNGPDLIAAESMKLPARDFSPGRVEPPKGTAFLPPRISQPARLNAFILPRDGSNKMESRNIHFDPVCGWLVPNFLDNSIHVYDGDGVALGILQIRQNAEQGEQVVWIPVPGTQEIVDFQDLNSHLRFAISFIYDHNAANFREFLRITFASLENIQPGNANRFSSTAMLMGKPLALLRLGLDLQVKGHPANDQSWEARMGLYDKRSQHNHGDHSNRGFGKVRFPIRLGDMSQVDDGLVGYFIRRNDETKPHEFFSPVSIFEQEMSYDELMSIEEAASAESTALREEVARVKVLIQTYRYMLVQSGPVQLDEIQNMLTDVSEADALLTSLPPANPTIKYKDLEEMVYGKTEMNKEIAVKLDQMCAAHQIEIQVSDLKDIVAKFSNGDEDASSALAIVIGELDEAEVRVEKWPRNDAEWDHYGQMIFQGEFDNANVPDENASPGIFLRPPERDLSLSCDSEDLLELLILMDPRAPVHVTSGILPERTVRIEEEAVDNAIRNIQMTFMTASVLSTEPERSPDPTVKSKVDAPASLPTGKMMIPTLKEEGVSWSWLENRQNQWQEFASHDLTTPTEQKQDVDGPITLRDGWLKLKKTSE